MNLERQQGKLVRAIGAFRIEMEQPPAGPDIIFDKPPPFVTPLVAEFNVLAPKKKQEILKVATIRSHEYDIPYEMSLMMRFAGDQSGLLGKRIGVDKTSDETKATAEEQGIFILDQIEKLPDNEYEAVVKLFDFGTVSYDAIYALDKILKQVDDNLGAGNNTQEMKDFREGNKKELIDVHQNERRKRFLQSQDKKMWPEFMNIEKPTIIYKEENGIIHQQLLLPTMPIQNQEKLAVILPEELTDTEFVNPWTPLGAFLYINRAGHPLARVAAEIARELKKEKIRLDAKEKWETAVRAEAIYDLMTRIRH